MQIEFTILNFIQDYMQNSILTAILKIITYMGNAGLIWIFLSIIFALIKETRKIGFTMMIGLILCLIISNALIKPIVARARPFDVIKEEKIIEILIKKPTDGSFPSGHTLAAFTCAIIIWLYNKKLAIIPMIFAILTAFSRLYFYVHFPTDILAGIILGIIFAFMSKKMYKYLKNRFCKNNK